ncbi:hypothetical protein ABLE91_12970 [Aquabacter sp. CN5-332]
MIRAYSLSLLCIALFALFPVISVALVSLVATAAGCTVNEGGVHPCLIAGADLGGLLYTMGVLGWLGLVTLPVGAILLAVWAVLLLGHLGWRALRRPPR